MKLLVCDIEGTIFQPYMIRSAQHASYVWTAIAAALGKEAERKEINTQRKWANGDYGKPDSGRAYMNWVTEVIGIHREFGLKRSVFEDVIQKAPYIPGVEAFFHRLNRKEYIPVFISGGMQNLNLKACRDLGVDPDDSYASCEYFFDTRDRIDQDLTFMNTSNFFGKEELIRVSLRKHGLGEKDWVFFGDGVNDVRVAKLAPLSVGISPGPEFAEVCDHSFGDFRELLEKAELFRDWNLLAESEGLIPSPARRTYAQEVEAQVGKLPLDRLETRAKKKVRHASGQDTGPMGSRFTGIRPLLEDGERVLTMLENEGVPEFSSSLLQPFCSATEVMIYVTLALSGYAELLENLLSTNGSLKQSITHIENEDLQCVLEEYRHNRNIIAHAYQPLPAGAARSLARRTYETIQRLELIANPHQI